MDYPSEIIKKMRKFNNIQKKLVEMCERAHFEGLRHTGLSGCVCEDLLIAELKKQVPELNFHRGVIKFSNKTGAKLKQEEISTQIDIIIYKGSPFFK